MPELPEVEIVRRSLFQKINRAKIINVIINNKNLRYKIPIDFSKKLKGQKILGINRRSKYLIFYLEKNIILLHLGMSGKLMLQRDRDKKLFKTSFYYDINTKKKHDHVHFKLSNGLVLIYNDVRRFGFFQLYDLLKLNEIPFIKKLGPEPFDKNFNKKYFKKFVINKKKNIKSLLMDQSFVSGLGNIYVNEALFLSKVKPSRRCSNLNKKEIENLILNIQKILKLSISKGGSSIKDFKNTLGKTGSYQQFFYVYGKNGKKCSRISCNGKIKKIEISKRSTFYCSQCQS